jgi:hypothetical protein
MWLKCPVTAAAPAAVVVETHGQQCVSCCAAWLGPDTPAPHLWCQRRRLQPLEQLLGGALCCIIWQGGWVWQQDGLLLLALLLGAVWARLWDHPGCLLQGQLAGADRLPQGGVQEQRPALFHSLHQPL